MIKDIVKYIYRKNRENFTVNCIILLCGFILMGILFDNISVFYNDQKQSVDKLDPKGISAFKHNCRNSKFFIIF